jgi:molybdopterin converting factor small subunit
MLVEFLGIPRERTGVSEVELDAATLGDVLAALPVRFPKLRELMPGGALHSSVAASLNGHRFVSDPATRLAAGDRLILLSSDAGG